jgi:acyl-[acyl carrier protein]--UDP-N-acetylglucosamine O-acyltransferase
MNICKNIWKNIAIGKNNYIEKGVKIYENVVIGDNNKIYKGTVIYPNTVIGNNNVILNDNILGEHPVDSRYKFTEKMFNGLEIGDNNMFHIRNLVFSGHCRKTKIGDNNKVLAECHIGHDVHIRNNVALYARVLVGGISTLLDNSTMGVQSVIQQRSVIGEYAMLGMGNASSHNIFPFYIYFDRKYVRFNKVKIPEELHGVYNYDSELRAIITDLKNNSCDKSVVDSYNIPDNIKQCISSFLDTIEIKKI